jgi:hypothetical protein
MVVGLSWMNSTANGFVMHHHQQHHRPLGVTSPPWTFQSTTNQQQQHDPDDTSHETTILTLLLKKPLGLMLEEVDSDYPTGGVIVKEIAESGSVAALSEELKQKIVGATIASIQQTDVSQSSFTDVMEMIRQGPETIQVEFAMASDSNLKTLSLYEEGTEVEIVVKQNGKPDTCIVAKVGDNMRQKLLEYNVQVYEGLKQNLGNCGGAGQCTVRAGIFFYQFHLVASSTHGLHLCEKKVLYLTRIQHVNVYLL